MDIINNSLIFTSYQEPDQFELCMNHSAWFVIQIFVRFIIIVEACIKMQLKDTNTKI